VNNRESSRTTEMLVATSCNIYKSVLQLRLILIKIGLIKDM